jgi:lysozyme
LEKHYGQKPIFYTSTAFYGALIKGNFSDHSIWIQDLRPVISPDFDWLFWQISLRGQIEGITANVVDINIFNGNKSDFHNYLKN